MEASKKIKQPVSDLKIWYGVASGPIIWLLHLKVVYPFVSVSCHRGLFQGEVLGLMWIHIISLVLTVIAVAAVALGGFLSYQSLQQIRADPEVGQPEVSRYLFMAYSGILLSLLFGVTIAISAIPTVVLNTCAR